MDRSFKVILLALTLAAVATASFAQGYVLARFRVPPQPGLQNYLPGGAGDDLTSVTYFQRSWDPVGPSGGWLANQFTSPDIATPSTLGPEGGNALYGNSSNAATTRQGHWIQLAPAASGSFTFETFFYLTNLDADFAEYKMQNLVSSFWMSDNKAVELRYFGPGTTLPPPTVPNSIQVMTTDGTTEHNVTSAAGVVTANKWYYAAVVFDNVANLITFYLADASTPGSITPVSVGSASPGWGVFSMNWLCLAAWPNPAGSCRDITGYMDAFAFSYEALAPASFRLLNLPPIVIPAEASSWQIYQ